MASEEIKEPITKIRIHITKEILEKSKYCGNGNAKTYAPTNCAFAHAVRGIFQDAHVGPCQISTGFGGIDLTFEMREFIRKFDELMPEERVAMKEESFDLEIPDSIIEQIDIQDIINSSVLELV